MKGNGMVSLDYRAFFGNTCVSNEKGIVKREHFLNY